MAKLKGPLFSLGASQQLGKSLVFFNWKGLNVVREYVVPANPKTTAQNTQRAHLTAAVAAIHAAMARPTLYLSEVDKMAYALWASVVQSATTWFNQAVRCFVDMAVKGWQSDAYRGGDFGGGALKIDGVVYSELIKAGGVTTGKFYYGTSKTSLVHPKDAAIDLPTNKATLALTGLAPKTKYFIQFRPTAVATVVGFNSGIYYATTS